MLRAAVVSFVVVAVAVLAPGDAAAQKGKKKGSACGIRGLPLVVGNQWTYSPSMTKKAPEAQARFIPPVPSKIVISVMAIDQKDGATVVRLLEEIDDRKIESTITCNDKDKRIEISMNAFYFAGEPGGYIGLEFPKLERKGSGLVLKAGKFEETWREDIVGTWKRNPSEGVAAELGSGTLQMERVFTLNKPEPVAGPDKTLMVPKLSIEITGRIGLDGSDGKVSEMPANWVNNLWFADDIGVVQVTNSFLHQYNLIKFTPGTGVPPTPAAPATPPPAK
jgi:hypothetical protein